MSSVVSNASELDTTFKVSKSRSRVPLFLFDVFTEQGQFGAVASHVQRKRRCEVGEDAVVAAGSLSKKASVASRKPRALSMC